MSFWPPQNAWRLHQEACSVPPRLRLIHHPRGPRLDAPPAAVDNVPVSEAEIDAYLARLDEPRRSTLNSLRRTILDIVPDAEQCISYRMPAFRLHGKVVAGFAAFTNHLSYLPHSGSVFSQLPAETAGYTTTTGALHFPIDQPLPRELVEQLIAVRLREVAGARGRKAVRAGG
jgi:uncharacterized protein YdhG (YjbR/CyaY superfamily)